MPAITSSAPGKIILFGEHAVVYGRPAIAIPVNQVRARAVVKADPLGEPGRVRVQAPQVHLDADLDQMAADDPIARAITSVLSTLEIQRSPACTIRLTSTIPVAAGLGSGAAVSVALIRAYAGFLGTPLSDARVSALAYEVEILHHGTPSGIDNTVITYRKPVYYVKDQPIQTVTVGCPITVVIADTGIPAPTAVTVSDVREAWQASPERYEALFDAIGDIARSARQAIEGCQLSKLGLLMDKNHELLQDLGVSSPELDRLVDAARRAGALGAKLSGGGRGGNMIALVSADLDREVAQALQATGAKDTIITGINP